MTKKLQALVVVFACALITAAFVIVFAVGDRPTSSVPRVPSAPTTATGAVPVPPVTATTIAPVTVGPVWP